jgi:hypothetical protein
MDAPLKKLSALTGVTGILGRRRTFDNRYCFPLRPNQRWRDRQLQD